MEQDYRQQLSAKLEAAKQRVKQGNELRALKSSAPSLFDVIDGEISLAVNEMTQPSPLSYEEYLSKHGQVRGYISIRNLIDSKVAIADASAQEVEAIKDAVKQLDNSNEKSK